MKRDVPVLSLGASLQRTIDKRHPDVDVCTVITITISGSSASLCLSTILRWTSSLTPTPVPGYGATSPLQTPPPLRILLQNHLLLYIPKRLLSFAKNLLDNLDYFGTRSRCS